MTEKAETGCEACAVKLDPAAFQGKSLMEGLAVGVNYGNSVLEAHHTLIRALEKERDGLRQLLVEVLPRDGFYWTRKYGKMDRWTEEVRAALDERRGREG